jgi:translation initiation factor 5A
MDSEFQSASSGASATYPTQCSALRQNGHVVIKGRPCKIVDMATCRTGKHGHAKVNLVGIDLFTGKKFTDMSPSTHNMEVPNVGLGEYTLMDIQDGFLSLLLPDGSVKEDVKLPDDRLGQAIRADFESGREVLCTVLAAMGEEACVSHKFAP